MHDIGMGTKMEPGGEESEEESGPLYRMDALTSEADILISSPSGKSDHYITQSEEEEEPTSDDTEETPIVRKIIVMKGKGKEVMMVAKGRAKVSSSSGLTSVNRLGTERGGTMSSEFTIICWSRSFLNGGAMFHCFFQGRKWLRGFH